MTQNAPHRMPQFEFVALMGMLAAVVAFSIDAMLPGLSRISDELSPSAPDQASLVVAVFMLGLGVGTLFAGSLADAFGRRPVILLGLGLYIVAALLSAFAYTLEALLLARFVQGLGASGPRIAVLAVVRDCYQGREMARLVSFVMLVFTLVPVLAPTLGAWIIFAAGWRGIFFAFATFATLLGLWIWSRLSETLEAEKKRPFRFNMMVSGLRELWGIKMVRLSIILQTLVFSTLFSLLSSTQLIFDQTFDRAHEFHLWFGGIALVAGTSGFLNAKLVVKHGMRAIVFAMLCVSTSLTIALVLLWQFNLPAPVYFGSFVLWQTTLFFKAGMSIGNLNTLAMEPVGHMAGLAASLIGAISTCGAALITVPTALIFNGTPIPLALCIAAFGIIGLIVAREMQTLERSA